MKNKMEVVLEDIRLNKELSEYDIDIKFRSDKLIVYRINVMIQNGNVLFDPILIGDVIKYKKDYIESKSGPIKKSMASLCSTHRKMSVGQIAAIFRLYYEDEDRMMKKETGDIIEEFLNSIQRRILERVVHPLGSDWSNYLM